MKYYIKDINGCANIVFEVYVLNNQIRYMSIQKSPSENENRAIVVVDAEKFLELWKKEPNSIHYEISHGNPETWRKDKKYPYAESDFSQGENSPVLLAEVSFSSSTPAHIGFTDGITKTIWLLSNGCREFPVECMLSYACGLYKAAGAEGTCLNTVDGILKSSGKHGCL